MSKTLFIALDYLPKNHELMKRLRSCFSRIVVASRRDQAIAELVALGSEVDAIIIGLDEKIDRSVLDRLPNLALVGYMGVGTDRIDVSLLAERKIALVTAKGANSDAVAEHALSLMLAALKGLPNAFRASERGLGRFALGRPHELRGKTVGTVGAGASAYALHRLLFGFQCRRLFWTPNPDRHKEMEDVATYVTLDELFAQSNIVSLHIPLTAETERLVIPERIRALPEGAILVNVSRGGLVATAEVKSALVQRRDMIYAVDDPPVQGLAALGDRLLSTPHIAGITSEALIAMQHKVVGDMMRHARGVA
jgi:D-3-phosphoglycerate dehydrogenase